MDEIGETQNQVSTSMSETRERERADPWRNSEIIYTLKTQKESGRPIRLAFLDIDSTLTGNPESAVKVRDNLKELGFATVFVTSRTEEMTMSKASYEQSKESGFSRPIPKLTNAGGKMQMAFPEEVEGHAGLYDADVVAATTGSSLYVKQREGGYLPDNPFHEQMRQDGITWREKTTEVVKAIDPIGTLFRLTPLDIEGSYDKGDVDVFLPEFRIQLEVNNNQPHSQPKNTGSTESTSTAEESAVKIGRENKAEILKRIDELRFDKNTPETIRSQLANVRATDDSNPDKGRYAIYLTPNRGWKANAVEHTISEITKSLNVPRSELHTLFAGDSFPDVGMGLYGGLDTDATFLVVGGSRLTDVLSGKTEHFGGKTFDAIRNRMNKTGDGQYSFKTPLVSRERIVILGNLKYPGTKGPDTINAYLADNFKQ